MGIHVISNVHSIIPVSVAHDIQVRGGQRQGVVVLKNEVPKVKIPLRIFNVSR